MIRFCIITAVLLFISTAGIAQNYTIQQTSFTIQSGQTLSVPFAYNTGMNGMNGPIRRALGASTINNQTSLGSYDFIQPATQAECLSTTSRNYTFEWTDPANSPFWNPAVDGNTFVIEFGDFNGNDTSMCEDNTNPNLVKNDADGNSDYLTSPVTITLTFVESEAIPTLGEWGLILLSLSMLIIGLVTLRASRYNLSSKS